MKYLKLLMIALTYIIGHSAMAQSILPNDTTGVQQVQNYEFINGSIVLTSKGTPVNNGTDFTNGLIVFEKSLGYSFRSLQLSYNYSTESPDTALVRLLFKNPDNTEIGRMNIPLYKTQTHTEVSIVNPAFVDASKFEVYIYSTGSPWIRDGSILTLNSMIASNQYGTNASNYFISPNPSSEIAQITSIDGSMIHSIQILNNSGLLLKEYTNINDAGFLLNVNEYLSGIYYVTISSATGLSSKIIVIQH